MGRGTSGKCPGWRKLSKLFAGSLGDGGQPLKGKKRQSRSPARFRLRPSSEWPALCSLQRGPGALGRSAGQGGGQEDAAASQENRGPTSRDPGPGGDEARAREGGGPQEGRSEGRAPEGLPAPPAPSLRAHRSPGAPGAAAPAWGGSDPGLLGEAGSGNQEVTEEPGRGRGGGRGHARRGGAGRGPGSRHPRDAHCNALTLAPECDRGFKRGAGSGWENQTVAGAQRPFQSHA